MVEPGDTVTAGVFKVEFIHVNHSIPGACALAIHTPVGVIVHTGDFKIDFTPQDGAPLNFGRFAELGNQGVLALLADSTNVERPGYTISEKKVAETFNSLFAKANGRVIIAMFASNVFRHSVRRGFVSSLWTTRVSGRAQHGQRRKGCHSAGIFEYSGGKADLGGRS